MTPILYAHPFSSYSQKAIIAFYETDIAFTLKILDADHPEHGAAFARMWPLAKFPLLVIDRTQWPEASIIVEWIDRAAGGGRLIPADAAAALDVRLRDRIFDNYVMAPMMTIVVDGARPADARDPLGVEQARALLDRSYAWLDAELATREWAAGATFSLADCAAAPALLYADWAYPIPDALTALRDYRARLLARPAVARVVDEARPYRHLFPLPVPDRD